MTFEKDLPESLMLTEIPCKTARPIDVKTLRAVFTRDVKPAFLEHLATTQQSALHNMGITDDGIAYMLNGNFPRNHPGEQLDCSIDHIVSLHFGGTNDFRNLMLVPMRINALKDRLENTQLEQTTTGHITTIVPRDGTPVPFIPGGFSRNRRVTL